MERAFRNNNMKPLSHSSYLRLQVLRESFWDVDDKLSCLVNLSLSDLEAFIPNLLSQVIERFCLFLLARVISRIEVLLHQPVPIPYVRRCCSILMHGESVGTSIEK